MATYPVPILNGRNPSISDSYDATGSDGSRVHRGSDIMYRRLSKGVLSLPVFSPHYEMPNGVPALAFEAGKVTRASMIGTGGRVRIDHGNGLETAYYHLLKPTVRVGQVVKEGQPVGNIYHNISGYKLNHLHFEVFKNGSRIDPGPVLANAQMIVAPSQAQFLLKVAGAIVAGVLISKYVFK